MVNGILFVEEFPQSWVFFRKVFILENVLVLFQNVIVGVVHQVSFLSSEGLGFLSSQFGDFSL